MGSSMNGLKENKKQAERARERRVRESNGKRKEDVCSKKKRVVAVGGRGGGGH